MSVSITFGDLWWYGSDGAQKKRPLSAMKGGRGHIHGRLTVKMGERFVPGLGYWGPGDVCFGVWVHELIQARRVLSHTDPARYVFDEGEQGQPAYQFDREGDSLFLSLVDSEVDGEGIPSWQRVECVFDDFGKEVHKLATEFRATLLRENPRHGEAWWRWAIERPE